MGEPPPFIGGTPRVIGGTPRVIGGTPRAIGSALRDLETDRDMLDAMDFIESLITVNGNSVTPPMRVAIKEALDLMKNKNNPETRTLSSFVQYVQYQDPDTRRPVFKSMLSDYLWNGGKYGKIFDSKVSGISLNTRFLAIEMEDLMNRGAGCIVPALVYLFNLVEKKFDGRLSMLILDEAWLFLKNETFSEKIAEWLKVLRKKNVFVVFATQDVADVEKSPLKSTIIQQCLTKIYLADPNALTMQDTYSAFGLSLPEIELIATSQMKRDYFYTSPIGRRLFQLDLGTLSLALIGTPDHELLDSLVAKKGFGIPLCRDILEEKRIPYNQYIDHKAPREKEIKPVEIIHAEPPVVISGDDPEQNASSSSVSVTSIASVLDAVAKIVNRQQKGEGRAAEQLSKKIKIGVSTIYQARKLLRFGTPELIEQVRKGRIAIRKACKIIDEQKQPEEIELKEAVNA